MVMFLPFAAVVCAIAWFPVWVLGLGVFPCGALAPVWAAAFYGFEVAVGVAFYLLLSMATILVALHRVALCLVRTHPSFLAYRCWEPLCLNYRYENKFKSQVGNLSEQQIDSTSTEW